MKSIAKEEMNLIAHLFKGWEETLIWSCLQGYMGKAWADDMEPHQSARIITGDFCFLAGEPDKDMLNNIPAKFMLLLPGGPRWEALIETVYQKKAKKVERYAIKKEPLVFDRQVLLKYMGQLPVKYSLEIIGEDRFRQVREESWSGDLCPAAQFPSYESYAKYGMGVVAVWEESGIVASGASSYGVYDKGIEIEVDTKKGHRRKGLALACASKLILECLDRGIYPSWDAQNMGSVHLAEKLGYHFDKAYVAYEVEL